MEANRQEADRDLPAVWFINPTQSKTDERMPYGQASVRLSFLFTLVFAISAGIFHDRAEDALGLQLTEDERIRRGIYL